MHEITSLKRAHANDEAILENDPSFLFYLMDNMIKEY
jgi:hypothetical protein